jgi:polysaccharide biosynthesis protein PslH
MKILFITPSPPNNLNRIRSKNIIISLCKLNHEISLVSLVKNKKERRCLDLMGPYVKDSIGVNHSVWLSFLQCFLGLFLPFPLRVSYCYSRKMLKELRKEKYNDFDLVYIKRLRMAQYAKLFSNQKKVFIDLTDSMTKYYQRLKSVSGGLVKILALEEYFKHKLYEPKICNQYKNLIICSHDDKNYLIDNFNCREKSFYVLENGINFGDWRKKQKIIKNNLYNLVFWGVMNVETNILSCHFLIKKVMPLLSNKFSLTIIGPSPSKKLIKYSNERIKFTGYVNNINQSLLNLGIFVCPIMSGAGVKNKILQACSIGLPTVSNELGVEGINLELKKVIFVANGTGDFVDKINQISNMDEEKIKDLQKRQINLVKKYYDIQGISKAFHDNFLK